VAAVAQRPAWTKEEEIALRERYPTGSWSELKSVLSRRDRSAIVTRAAKLGVRREQREYTDEFREKQAKRLHEHPIRFGHGIASPVIVRDGISGKACVKCLEWKPLEKFSRHQTCAGGRRNICTTCEGRMAYVGNPKKRIAAVRRYQEAHYEEYLETKRVASRCRHGREMIGKGVTAKQWREIRAAFDGKCAYCGEPADTLDHVIPLSLGGQHEPGNVVPACKRCNFRKHTKIMQPRRI